MNGQAGKGDQYRPYDRETFEANYEAIFGKKRKGCKQKSNRAKCRECECPRKSNSK